MSDSKIEARIKDAEAMLLTGGKPTPMMTSEQQALWFRAAQVYATLALVEAVREQTRRTARRS